MAERSTDAVAAMTTELSQDGASGDRGFSRADSNVTGNAHADGALLPPPLVLGAADDDGDDDDDADDSDSWLEPENRRANGGCGCDGEGACVETGDDAWTEGGEQMGHFLSVRRKRARDCRIGRSLPLAARAARCTPAHTHSTTCDTPLRRESSAHAPLLASRIPRGAVAADAVGVKATGNSAVKRAASPGGCVV